MCNRLKVQEIYENVVSKREFSGQKHNRSNLKFRYIYFDLTILLEIIPSMKQLYHLLHHIMPMIKGGGAVGL